MSTCIKNTVQNFSSYQLTTEEFTALSYGLNHHISSKFNNNRIQNELEQFYQSIFKDISYMPENNSSCLKTKLQNTCEKYNKGYVSYKFKKTINQLSRNKDLIILKEDTGRGAV